MAEASNDERAQELVGEYRNMILEILHDTDSVAVLKKDE
jgi:hypothetical protein